MNDSIVTPFPIIPSNPRSECRRRLIFGVGINDADYLTHININGKKVRCPIYLIWSGMLMRCYCNKYQQKKPTYIGCTVTQEWLTFSVFRKWVLAQDWNGLQLDKDILVPGNKVYGADFCVFVDAATNMLLNDRAGRRGEWPIGVSYHKAAGRFMASCGGGGARGYLGLFSSPEDAHEAYISEKSKAIRRRANMQADDRVRDALLLRATALQEGGFGLREVRLGAVIGTVA